MSNYNQPQPNGIQSNMQSGQVPQNSVVCVTVPPQSITVQIPEVQINLVSHRQIAILEFFTVVVIFTLEVSALCVKNEVAVLFTGIWFAPLIFVTALLGYFGGVKKSKCLIISCMVMAIITCCLAVVAIAMYSIELSLVNYILAGGYNYLNYPNIYSISCQNCAGFIKVKNIIGEVAAVFIFFLTIVQSVFCCKDVCSCCHRNTSGIIVPPQQQAIFIQHQQMQPTVYPFQQPYVNPRQQQFFSPQPSQVIYSMQNGNYSQTLQTYPIQTGSYSQPLQAYPIQGGSYSQPLQAYPMQIGSYSQPHQAYPVQGANNNAQSSHEYAGVSEIMPPSYEDFISQQNSEDLRKS